MPDPSFAQVKDLVLERFSARGLRLVLQPATADRICPNEVTRARHGHRGRIRRSGGCRTLAVYIGDVRHREASSPVAVLRSRSATSRPSCP